MNKYVLFVLAFLATACGNTLEPEPGLPAGALPFDPPSSYAVWWSQVEACSGLNGNFSAVRWYQVPDATIFFESGDSKPIKGLWSPHANTITLAGRLVDDSMLVRHEQLHALLRSVDHPSLYFVTRCGTLVYPG
jgi:hypothetical protein